MWLQANWFKEQVVHWPPVNTGFVPVSELSDVYHVCYSAAYLSQQRFQNISWGLTELPTSLPPLTSPSVSILPFCFWPPSCISFGRNEECKILVLCPSPWIFCYYISTSLCFVLFYKTIALKISCDTVDVERVLKEEYQHVAANWCVLQNCWLKLVESPKDAASKMGRQGLCISRHCWHSNHNICL